MRVKSATFYALAIPFRESFSHALKVRKGSDALVLRIETEDGTVGYGEAAPRPYVSGETVDSVLDHGANVIWPALLDRAIPDPLGPQLFDQIQGVIPDQRDDGVIAHNSCRAAFEVALVDCLLRSANRPFADLLPPVRTKVRYDGAIDSSTTQKAARMARVMKAARLPHIKVKVGLENDADRLNEIRRILGPDKPIRVDANCAWTVDEAVEALAALARFDIEAVEQPIPRGDVAELRRLRDRIEIPIVVDESLVTLEDAHALIAHQACDVFNIRISKCGGFGRCLTLAALAHENGLGVQIGAHVGETAILSAAGRHLAAALPEVKYLEGSYGTLVLSEDVATVSVKFGFGGSGKVLRGPGLGVRVKTSQLEKFADRTVEMT